MNWLTRQHRIAVLKAYQKRRNKKLVVTADELIARMKRNWPSLTEEEIDDLYQAAA
jgi:hypothetical protein